VICPRQRRTQLPSTPKPGPWPPGAPSAEPALGPGGLMLVLSATAVLNGPQRASASCEVVLPAVQPDSRRVWEYPWGRVTER
jgi:hypothetical protein